MKSIIISTFILTFLIASISVLQINSASTFTSNQNNMVSNKLKSKHGPQTEFIVFSEDPAVTKLREYVRINTSHPIPDYESAIEWFRKQATEYFDLEFHLERFNSPNLFAMWLTWKGTNPNLKSVLLNSHMDVVDVNRKNWIHDPFEAYKDPNGNIYGRGVLDMKSATIAELEALRRLKNEGFKPLRTIHVSVMPDEELGGVHGMKVFVNSEQFKALNVGFDLDEAGAGNLQEDGKISFRIPHAQKSAWQFNITAQGVTGHASSAVRNGTAGQKMQIIIDRLMEKRESELLKLDTGNLTASDITTINLVKLGGGLANNILPAELSAVFDMRIRAKPDEGWNFTDVIKFLDDICTEAGPGVSYTFLQQGIFIKDTPVDNTNVWWTTLNNTCNKMNWDCQPVVISPTSDAGYLRNVGIAALGFNANIGRYSAGLGGIHADNEAMNEKDFLESIDRYKIVIKDLSMISNNYP